MYGRSFLKNPRFTCGCYLLFSLFFISCAAKSTFQVKSDPLQADVFVMDEKNEKKPLGKTPLEIKEPDLKTVLGNATTPGEFFTVAVEKPGYLPQIFNIPASSFSASLTLLDVKLKEGTSAQEVKLAKQIIDHLFLAQKLAVTQQFERAQIEIDKILVPFPNFARALSMRASIYFAQKNYPESAKWYEEALKADPDMEEAVKLLAKVRALQSGNSSVDTNLNKSKALETAKEPSR